MATHSSLPLLWPKRPTFAISSHTLAPLPNGTLRDLGLQRGCDEPFRHHLVTHTVILLTTSSGIKTGKATIALFAMNIVTLDDTGLVLKP